MPITYREHHVRITRDHYVLTVDPGFVGWWTSEDETRHDEVSGTTNSEPGS
jgi:hypothetical protein